MSKEAFENQKTAIEAIPKDEIVDPPIPISVALQESEDLHQWAQDDAPALEEAGLDMKLLNELPARAAALRYAQSMWQNEYTIMEHAQVEWSKLSPEAYDLRDNLIHHLRHAYFKMPALTAQIKVINDGWGNADMIQDLSDLAMMGKANPAPLTRIKFDMKMLDKAEEFSVNLPELLAQANGLRNLNHPVKTLRDRAFTYMKQAVDEIRRHGVYKFWRTPERRKGYVSKYNSRKNAPDKPKAA